MAMVNRRERRDSASVWFITQTLLAFPTPENGGFAPTFRVNTERWRQG
jgi:hypothetical protein